MGYIYINSFSAVILLLLLYYYNKVRSTSHKSVYFQLLMILLILFTFADLGASFIGNTHFDYSLQSPRCLTAAALFILSKLLLVTVFFCWFIFAEISMNETFLDRKRSRFYSSIPLLITYVLIFTSPITGLIFYLDETGLHRGFLYNIFSLILFIYLLVPCFHALIRIPSKSTGYEREPLYAIIKFAIIPVSATILQHAIQLPIVAGLTFSTIWIMVSMLEHAISEDFLTGLNNRNKFQKELSLKIARADRFSQNLYLLIMDINNFKAINDTYGHPEGDRALILVAEVLKTVTTGTNYFIARIGGDEFAAIFEAGEETKAIDLVSKIHGTIEKKTKSAQKAYTLSLSIGMCEYDKGESLQQFLERTDINLYNEKTKFKQR